MKIIEADVVWAPTHHDCPNSGARQELYGVEARDRGAPRKARERLQEIRETRPVTNEGGPR